MKFWCIPRRGIPVIKFRGEGQRLRVLLFIVILQCMGFLMKDNEISSGKGGLRFARY